MKMLRAAGYCGAAVALLCAGAARVKAGSLEDDQAGASALFDNTRSQAESVGDGSVQAGSGAQAGPAGMGSSGAPALIRRDAAAPPSPLIQKADAIAGTLKNNWKPLLAGAAAGALLGVALGSTIPIAGPVIGGIIGAVMGAGIATNAVGDDAGSRMGKVMTMAGAGAMAGMAFGSAFPIIGTAIGGIAGALLGAGLGLWMTK